MVTFITLGVFSIIAAFLTLCLPETGDEDLPDTLVDAETLGDANKNGGLAAKTEYDDNTLVRSEDCTQTQYSEVSCFKIC